MSFLTVEQFLPVVNDTTWSVIVFPVPMTDAPFTPNIFGKPVGAVATAEQPASPIASPVMRRGRPHFLIFTLSILNHRLVLIINVTMDRLKKTLIVVLTWRRYKRCEYVNFQYYAASFGLPS